MHLSRVFFSSSLVKRPRWIDLHYIPKASYPRQSTCNGDGTFYRMYECTLNTSFKQISLVGEFSSYQLKLQLKDINGLCLLSQLSANVLSAVSKLECVNVVMSFLLHGERCG